MVPFSESRVTLITPCFGQVGMRNFHVHPNNANLCQPGINLDKLWSLVSEQVDLVEMFFFAVFLCLGSAILMDLFLRPGPSTLVSRTRLP